MIRNLSFSSQRQRPARRDGFTIVEVIIAILVLVIGLLGMAGIMGATVHLQQLTSSRAEITTTAEAKIEELRAYGMTASTDALRAKVAVGGSTTTATTGYNDNVVARGKTYSRKWAISQDVVGTRRVRIRVNPVVNGKHDVAALEFTSLIWLR